MYVYGAFHNFLPQHCLLKFKASIQLQYLLYQFQPRCHLLDVNEENVWRTDLVVRRTLPLDLVVHTFR